MADERETFWRQALADTADLDTVSRAVARERAIRETMGKTGESREIVVEVLDAMISMGDEAVLTLTEGEATTLKDGVVKYVGHLEAQGDTASLDVAADLTTLVEHSWPVASPPREALALDVGCPEDDEHLVVKLGGREVASANHDEHGWSGMEAVQRTAEQVHAAMISALTS